MLLKFLLCGNVLQSKNIGFFFLILKLIFINFLDLRQKFNILSWLSDKDFNLILSCLDDDFQLCQEIAFSILTFLNYKEINFVAF